MKQFILGLLLLASSASANEFYDVQSFYYNDMGSRQNTPFIVKTGRRVSLLAPIGDFFGKKTIQEGSKDCSKCLYVLPPHESGWVVVAKRNGKEMKIIDGPAEYTAYGYTLIENSRLKLGILRADPKRGSAWIRRQ